MAKRAEIAGQGLIILDAKGVADRPRDDRAGSRTPAAVSSTATGRGSLIGEVPQSGTPRRARARRGVRSVHAGAVRDTPRGLSEAETPALAAWNLRVSRGAMRRRRRRRPLDGERWDTAVGDARSCRPTGPDMTHVGELGPRPSGALGLGRRHQPLSHRRRRGRDHHRRGPDRGPAVQRCRADQGRGRGPGGPDLARQPGAQGRRHRSPMTSGPSGSIAPRTRRSAATSHSKRTGAIRRWPSSGSRRTSAASRSTSRRIRRESRHEVGATSRSSPSTRSTTSPTRSSRASSCTTATTAGDPTTSTASSPTRPGTSSAVPTSTPRATARATRRPATCARRTATASGARRRSRRA